MAFFRIFERLYTFDNTVTFDWTPEIGCRNAPTTSDWRFRLRMSLQILDRIQHARKQAYANSAKRSHLRKGNANSQEIRDPGWAKPMAISGRRAVAILSRAARPAEVKIDWSNFGLDRISAILARRVDEISPQLRRCSLYRARSRGTGCGRAKIKHRPSTLRTNRRLPESKSADVRRLPGWSTETRQVTFAVVQVKAHPGFPSPSLRLPDQTPLRPGSIDN
jgi:hypothetical protein